jgi:hypothetical protein
VTDRSNSNHAIPTDNTNDDMKMIRLILLAVAAMGALLRREIAAANTYDAAVETHDSTVNRTNDAAITARHLLWKAGATDNGVALGDATSVPLGTIDNTTTLTGINQTVRLLGKGATKKMVANAAITVGSRVFTAASGKVSPTHGATLFQVGIALTAAAADGDIIEVADCAPIKTNA